MTVSSRSSSPITLTSSHAGLVIFPWTRFQAFAQSLLFAWTTLPQDSYTPPSLNSSRSAQKSPSRGSLPQPLYFKLQSQLPLVCSFFPMGSLQNLLNFLCLLPASLSASSCILECKFDEQIERCFFFFFVCLFIYAFIFWSVLFMDTSA